MPGNKSKPNAFSFFMRDYKEKEERAGRTFNDMSDVVAAAGPIWEKMSIEERKPYNLKKMENKEKRKGKKYTNLGQDVDLLQKRDQEEIRKRKEMEQDIEELVADGNDYINKSFFVAHVNHYCYCNTLRKHIPAEISIVRFCLQTGVNLEDCFHAILDPGSMPIGYRLAATTISDESHLIPVPPHDEDYEHISEKDIKKSFQSMIEFLRKNLEPRQFLAPLYIDDPNIDMAKDVFKNLYDEFGGNNVFNELKIYSLSYLFYVLRNAAHSKVAQELAFPFHTIAQAELEKDIYDFVKGIECEYHRITTDAYPHCTLSKCIRKVFIICDHTCYDLGISLIPGRHVPKNAKIEKLDQRPNSQIIKAPPPVLVSTMPTNNSKSIRSKQSAPIASVTGLIQRSTQNRIAADFASVASSSNTSSFKQIRKPQTISVAMDTTSSDSDYNVEFPKLGSERPKVIGRGRGRILESTERK